VISYGGGPILGSLFRKSPYAVDIEGSGRTKLRLPEHLGDRYSWSPDGNWVISISHYPATADSEYRADVIIIPVDEGPSHQIVSDGSTKWDPAWGPNGEYIAYDANAPESRIYLANVGCIYEQDDCQIEPFELAAGGSPAWSPDGTKIVFDLDSWLYTVEIETRSVTALQVEGRDPAWSPYGDRIAYSWESDIYILDLDSGEISNVTNGIGGNGFARWTPSGEGVLFLSKRDGLGKAVPWGEYASNGLFKIDLTTGSVIRLSEYDDIRITWYAIVKE
jgi:Tol biopolymer transport system component